MWKVPAAPACDQDILDRIGLHLGICQSLAVGIFPVDVDAACQPYVGTSANCCGLFCSLYNNWCHRMLPRLFTFWSRPRFVAISLLIRRYASRLPK